MSNSSISFMLCCFVIDFAVLPTCKLLHPKSNQSNLLVYGGTVHISYSYCIYCMQVFKTVLATSGYLRAIVAKCYSCYFSFA